ncbi:MAG: hypothetical protein JNK15_13445, partial [Planctomycetes bacterium]|nr:hypothetical protein [Planctomycetota bacterium]
PVGVFAHLPNGNLVAGGFFRAAGGVACLHVARHDGLQWRALAPGCDGIALAAAGDGYGKVYVGGDFLGMGGATVNHVARFESAPPMSLGAGTNGPVSAIAADPFAVYVGGAFDTAGGAPAAHIAHWSPVTGLWSPLGAGLSAPVLALARVGPQLFAGGSFQASGGLALGHVAAWTGSVWSPLGVGVDDQVNALAVFGTQRLAVGGLFATAGGAPSARIAVWDPATQVWSALGSGITDPNGEVEAIVELANGDLLVGGAFATAGGLACANLARWNGNTWASVGSGCNGRVRSLLRLPDGDVLLGGDFTTAGGVACAHLARWDGSTFTAAGTGTDGPVQALAWYGTSPFDQGVLAAGAFTHAGGQLSVGAARWLTPCPATADKLGTPCPHSTGTAVLTTSELPWAGATFDAFGLNLPANSLVVTAIAVQTGPVPLSWLLPNAGPNCTLMVNPLVLLAAVPTGGVVPWSLAIPDSPAVVGLGLYAQMVTLEFDALGTWFQSSNTNALSAWPGRF